MLEGTQLYFTERNGTTQVQNVKMQNVKTQNVKMQNVKMQNVKMQNLRAVRTVCSHTGAGEQSCPTIIPVTDVHSRDTGTSVETFVYIDDWLS